MEEEVKDAVLTSDSDDPILLRLIVLAIESIQSGRPLFSSPLHEPILWRKFHRWVKEAMAEAEKIRGEK